MIVDQMKIRVKQAMIVKPAEETPTRSLWLSNLDLIQVRFHMGTLYFYHPCSSSNLPNTQSLIDALSKVLVLFYPAAGRLQKGKIRNRLRFYSHHFHFCQKIYFTNS